jgi:hypothetical protein
VKSGRVLNLAAVHADNDLSTKAGSFNNLVATSNDCFSSKGLNRAFNSSINYLNSGKNDNKPSGTKQVP